MSLDDVYKQWKQNPTPEASAGLLREANPILDRAITTYAGRTGPIMKAQAKSLALNAFETFDPKRGTKLRTHLMIRLQPLRRAAVQSGQVLSVPERMFYDRQRLDEARSEFSSVRDRDPTDDELADITGLSALRIRNVRKAMRPVVTPGQLGEEYEVPVDAPSAEDTWMEYVYYELAPVDKQILDWRLGRHGQDRIANNEIAKRLKLSPASISRRMAAIVARLQEGEGLAI